MVFAGPEILSVVLVVTTPVKPTKGVAATFSTSPVVGFEMVTVTHCKEVVRSGSVMLMRPLKRDTEVFASMYVMFWGALKTKKA